MSDASAALPNGFEILQKMWEAFTPPSAFTAPLTQLMESSAPLLSPEELEKRIAEMRAVEQWLTLNVNMLRSTIQAFEVQRATYATLRSFGASLGAAAQGMQGKAQAAPSQASEPAAPAPESAGEAGAGGAAAAGQSPFAEAASAEIAGMKTPMNLAKATATAAIVPVWTTRNIDQPKRKPTLGP